MDLRNITEFIKDASKYIIVIIFALLFFIFVMGLQQVIGPSMNPTLNEGDIIITNKFIYRFKSLERNDVVVISQDEKYMIKRIVGLPGETVEYQNNDVLINGKAYKETFTNSETEDFTIQDLGYDVIPEDMYLVLGDNRENSLDSRTFGLISKNQIIGKAWIKIWPISKMKIIK
ncbi:MAG: signal peptidase I [Tenericutes bacterium]|nr:signal peptidase I [Mycoplasmatota bacterium]